MANVHSKPNGRSARAWMIAGLIALILIAWIVASESDARDGRLVMDSASGVVADSPPAHRSMAAPALPQAVTDYLRFADEGRPAVDSAHRYTADGLRKLSAAIGALAERDTAGNRAVASQVEWLRGRADAIQRDWRSRDHARVVHNAILGAAALMNAVYQQGFPAAADETGAVVDAARAVRPDVPIVEQQENVETFFLRGADAIREMANTRG